MPSELCFNENSEVAHLFHHIAGETLQFCTVKYNMTRVSWGSYIASLVCCICGLVSVVKCYVMSTVEVHRQDSGPTQECDSDAASVRAVALSVESTNDASGG